MAAGYYRPGKETSLKKCSERVTNDCDLTETDGCCAGPIPCDYCITWEPETGTGDTAETTFATNAWAATIAGAAWLGFWERNYETGECEFVVTLDGTEIYRKSCYEGQSCRDSSDSAGATIATVAGTITWTKYEARPLEYVQDEETGCTTHFCDSCECSCECLCVTITEVDSTETKGEICDTSYQCDPPLWEGTVGTFELSIALGRDEYGRCIITATVGGEEQAPVLFSGCADGTATVTLGDGTTVAVTCKKCGCDETQLSCCSCDASYVGCTGATVPDDCLNDSIAGEVWSITSPVDSPHNDWGTLECNWFWTQNFVLSLEGCSPVETTFYLFQVTAPSAFAEGLGVQACDWVLEIWADGVYQGYVIEFARECIFEVETASNTLDWVQFYNVPVPGTSAEITLTMVRYESPSDLCVPSARP